MLKKFNITNIRKARTPYTSIYQELKINKKFDKTAYKSTIGSLIYLSRYTRPDISFYVIKVSRCDENPTSNNWKMVRINILKYLNYTKNYKDYI